LTLKSNQLALVASMLILSVVLAALLLPQTRAINQEEEEQKNKAAFLISTFHTANDSVGQTVSAITGKGITIPQVSVAAFREAQALVNQSITMNQKQKYVEAIDLATQALHQLKETITSIYRTGNITSTEAEIKNEQTTSLQGSVERNYEIIQRLENITNSASNAGTDTKAISEKISDIKANLAFAVSNLNHGNLSQAQEYDNQAKAGINELTNYFNSLAVTLKTQRVAAYINTSEQNLQTLRQQYNSVSNQLSNSVQASASAALTQAQDSLTKAKQYLNSQQLSQTIDELAKVNTNEKTVTDYIHTIAPTPTPKVTPTLSASNAASLNASRYNSRYNTADG
jgi:hypothetical protein